MAKKKKGQLPSGNIRVTAYDYTDETGKRHYQSFTAPTRYEAQAMAAEWKEKRRAVKARTTVADAVAGYIEIKTGVLSPSTIRAYISYQRNYFGADTEIGKADLRTLDNVQVQRFVSQISGKVSAKTAKNITGLNRTQFAKAYDIPLRTMEAWEAGDRKAPDYVIKLLERAVKADYQK